ncbi:MAG: hypothetical protein ABIT68_10205 [Sphingomicrobium sp.]
MSAERTQRRPRYARDERNGEDAGGRTSASPESIAFDALPPAIGRVDTSDSETDEAAPAPKRRAVRKPRPAASDGDSTPAA